MAYDILIKGGWINFGLLLAEVARQLGISTSGIAKILSLRLSS
jgi:hypothetical protein